VFAGGVTVGDPFLLPGVLVDVLSHKPLDADEEDLGNRDCFCRFSGPAVTEFSPEAASVTTSAAAVVQELNISRSAFSIDAAPSLNGESVDASESLSCCCCLG
jgi:hypothetical protein